MSPSQLWLSCREQKLQRVHMGLRGQGTNGKAWLHSRAVMSRPAGKRQTRPSSLRLSLPLPVSQCVWSRDQQQQGHLGLLRNAELGRHLTRPRAQSHSQVLRPPKSLCCSHPPSNSRPLPPE